MRTELVLVDDDDDFRAAARAVLGAAGFEVTAESATGRGALALAAASSPAVVLLDVQLPDIDGFEVLRRLRQVPDSPTVVLISTREAADYGRRIADSGAAGFITKARLSGASLRAILHTDGRSRP
jgi:DNA-binding NarL/FixJ family response regulator